MQVIFEDDSLDGRERKPVTQIAVKDENVVYMEYLTNYSKHIKKQFAGTVSAYLKKI